MLIARVCVTDELAQSGLQTRRRDTAPTTDGARSRVTCSNCGADNDPGRKFCLNCGQRLMAACPTCGTPNPPAAKFCGECGGTLAGDAALPVAIDAAPSTERRLVSVLFVPVSEASNRPFGGKQPPA
jgi:predicted amidophosphoribosyltransferase